MAVLSREDVVGLCARVGLNLSQIPVAGAICDAESGRRTDAVGFNPGSSHRRSSRDRGLWQINDVAHPDVSDGCAFDPLCNAQAMAAISSHGTNWTPWTTFNTGAYRQFLPAYQAIIGHGVTPSSPQPQDPISICSQKVARGYPVWKAALEGVESVVHVVQQRHFDPGITQTDLGSRLF